MGEATGYLIIGVVNDDDADGLKGPTEAVSGAREVLAQPGGTRYMTDAATGTTIPIPLPPGTYFPARTSYPRGYRSTTTGKAAVVVAGQTTTFWIGTTSLPAIPVTPPVSQPPVLEPGPVTMVKSLGGLDEGSFELIYPVAKEMNLGSFRVWISPDAYAFNERAVITKIKRAAAMAKALNVTPFFTVAQSNLKPGTFTDAKVRAYVRALYAVIRREFDAAGLTGMAVKLNTGNEPNLVRRYWWGGGNEAQSLATYNDAVCRPFAEAGRELGIYLIAPSISWNYNLLRSAAGDLLKNADALDFHPYPQTATDKPSDMAGFYKIAHAAETAKAHGVPLYLSELQMRRGEEYRKARAKGGKVAADSLKKISGEITALWAACKKYGVHEACIFHAWDINSENSSLRAWDYQTANGVKTKVWGSEFHSLYCGLS